VRETSQAFLTACIVSRSGDHRLTRNTRTASRVSYLLRDQSHMKTNTSNGVCQQSPDGSRIFKLSATGWLTLQSRGYLEKVISLTASRDSTPVFCVYRDSHGVVLPAEILILTHVGWWSGVGDEVTVKRVKDGWIRASVENIVATSIHV
jgi:hypothetical protein